MEKYKNGEIWREKYYGSVGFAEAAALLRGLTNAGSHFPAAAPSPWPARNLAGTLLNRANLLLDLSQPATAATAAREALSLAAPQERFEAIDGDLALKSRRALCDAHLRAIPTLVVSVVHVD